MGPERIARERGGEESRAAPVVARRRGAPDELRSLNAAIGNRAMGAALARKTTKEAPEKADPDAPNVEDVKTAEEWVYYLAQRGVGVSPPKRGVPARYLDGVERFKNAVVGVDDEKKDRAFVGDSRVFLELLRRHHDRVMPKGADKKVFDLAELALDRSVANLNKEEGVEGPFDRPGATQVDQARTLMILAQRAEEQLKEAKEAGYIIPKDLEKLAVEARAKFEVVKKSWDKGAPSSSKWITPTDEQELVKFTERVMEEVGSMVRKRNADWARARQAEADALEEAAEKKLTELRQMMADKRRGLFMAGETGELEKLHEALGEMSRAIDDMKDAAKKITKHVDRINAVAKIRKKGPVINLPAVPKSLSDIAAQIKGAHSKIGNALKLIKLIGPAKTELDGGLKVLEAAEMGLDHWAGKSNPIFAAYVNGYLGPGIRNCIKGIQNIAERYRSQNKDILSHPEWGHAIRFKVEPGGEAVWTFMHMLFKKGVFPIGPTAYEYFDDHRADISAAVRDPMPGSEKSIPGWAHRNRYALWETFYGSAKPPYDASG